MGTYIPNSEAEKQALLKTCGFNDYADMFVDIPKSVFLKDGLNLPSGMAELAVKREMEKLAQQNKVFQHIFRGAGAYNHYIPSEVKSVTSKEEFITAYTPYQAEISQGILQAIFEFQTMICELTGMDVANASVYDGATAAAEAVAMCHERKRQNTVYVSQAVNPQVIEVIKTYCFGKDIEVKIVPAKDGVTDIEALKQMIDKEASCFYMQQPNFYGNIEDAKSISEVVHNVKAKFIMGVNPIAVAIMQTPAEAGADIAVGEGQPLGIPLGFGGPYLGFMATTEKMMRKLPGRLVGQTVDVDRKRAFVLTLQAREQHIRREKASSNVCSNQQLCALTASVYMAIMGPDGIQEVAKQCLSKAHYLAAKLQEAGLNLKYNQEYFHEFVTVSDKKSQDILAKLAENGILGGLALNEQEILWCATEMNTKEEIDELAALVKEV